MKMLKVDFSMDELKLTRSIMTLAYEVAKNPQNGIGTKEMRMVLDVMDRMDNTINGGSVGHE